MNISNYEVAIESVITIAKYLKIDIPEVYFEKDEEFPRRDVSAFFLYDENYIVYNKDWLKDATSLEIVITAFHEVRHAYQAYSIKNNVNEDPETLKRWEEEFVIDSFEDEDNFKKSIEIDAIQFAHEKMYEIYGVKTFIPESIKHLIKVNYDE